jgi:hypothetical protein
VPDTTRNSAVQNVLARWVSNDPNAAATWLNTTSLPDDRKQRLLKNASRN